MRGLRQFMFTPAIVSVVKQNIILPYLMERLEKQPNLKWLYFFNDTRRYKFLDNTLDFSRSIRGTTDYITFTNKDGKQSDLDGIWFNDLDFIEWLMRNNDKLDDSPDSLEVKEMVIDLLDRLMDALIEDFHPNIFRNRAKGKMGYSDEVIIRQTAMAFWAAISIRNLVKSGTLKNSFTKDKVYDWKFGLAGPCKKFEELCNVINGTNHTLVREVFTPEFTNKEYAGHLSVATAIVNAIKSN